LPNEAYSLLCRRRQSVLNVPPIIAPRKRSIAAGDVFGNFSAVVIHEPTANQSTTLQQRCSSAASTVRDVPGSRCSNKWDRISRGLRRRITATSRVYSARRSKDIEARFGLSGPVGPYHTFLRSAPSALLDPHFKYKRAETDRGRAHAPLQAHRRRVILPVAQLNRTWPCHSRRVNSNISCCADRVVVNIEFASGVSHSYFVCIFHRWLLILLPHEPRCHPERNQEGCVQVLDARGDISLR
jgi:hypothetical protein